MKLILSFKAETGTGLKKLPSQNFFCERTVELKRMRSCLFKAIFHIKYAFILKGLGCF